MRPARALGRSRRALLVLIAGEPEVVLAVTLEGAIVRLIPMPDDPLDDTSKLELAFPGIITSGSDIDSGIEVPEMFDRSSLIASTRMVGAPTAPTASPYLGLTADNLCVVLTPSNRDPQLRDPARQIGVDECGPACRQVS